MKPAKFPILFALVACVAACCCLTSKAMAQDQAAKKPNIIVIMGDDIGMWNIGVYHRGMMYGQTPNIDRLAREGAIFTDYYAEASCTAGRANFITGELPIRTGLTTVGFAGALLGMPDRAPTNATVLREMGYANGQFGKKPPGRPEQVLAHAVRVRRVLWLSLPTPCSAGTICRDHDESGLGEVWSPQLRAQLGDGQGRHDGVAALGQGRQAEDRGRVCCGAHRQFQNDVPRRQAS